MGDVVGFPVFQKRCVTQRFFQRVNVLALQLLSALGFDGLCVGQFDNTNGDFFKFRLQTPEPAANYCQPPLGALLARGTASQSSIQARCVHHLRQKLGCPTLGRSATGASQDRRGGALVASDRSREWYTGLPAENHNQSKISLFQTPELRWDEDKRQRHCGSTLTMLYTCANG